MQNPTEWLDFNDYIKYDRIIEQGYYSIKHVRKSFYEVLSILGKPDKRDILVAVTVRLKGKANWAEANEASNTLHIRTTRRFWGRKSKYVQLPYVASIESSTNWDKEHFHALIRMSDLKQYYEPQEIELIVKDIAYGLSNVNKRDNGDSPAVKVRTFPYWEDSYKVLGRSIEYICKTSTNNYNPLEKKVYPSNPLPTKP